MSGAFRAWAGRGLGFAAGALAVLLALGAAAVSQYGSVDAAVTRLKGEQFIAPAYVDLGEMETGQTVTQLIEVANASDKTARIIGGTSDCSCITTNDLPIELAPGESRSLSITMRAPKSAGIFTRSVQLLTDNSGMGRIAFKIGGRVK